MTRCEHIPVPSTVGRSMRPALSRHLYILYIAQGVLVVPAQSNLGRCVSNMR